MPLPPMYRVYITNRPVTDLRHPSPRTAHAHEPKSVDPVSFSTYTLAPAQHHPQYINNEFPPLFRQALAPLRKPTMDRGG